jgi:hypothetical protein
MFATTHRKAAGMSAVGTLLALVLAAGPMLAQSKGPVASKGKAPAPAAKSSTAPPANLAQLMRGIFFPNSNVIFAAQDSDSDPAKVAPAKDPSTAVNPLEGAYGKWEAVENSALALSEAASLLTVSGRKCSNGRNVPLQNADWAKLVQGMRQAGLTAYKAAQSKDTDKILDAADVMTMACSNCHDKYREVEDRCK